MAATEWFSATDGDIVLRTSDNVKLSVHRRILAESSFFFKEMFSLPQSEDAADDDVPVIDVSEPAEVMDKLLRLVYPREDPPIDTLDELSALLAAAVKYEMQRATETLRRLLVAPRFAAKDPTRVYAIACRHDLEVEARAASTYTLSVNILDCPLSEDLKHITAWSYHRLLDLHRRRSAAALAALDDAVGQPGEGQTELKCSQCVNSHYGSICPPRWWLEFARRAKEELKVRPTSEVVFSMRFLAESSHTGCTYCPGSILESYAFLERLKERIDALPCTI